MLRTTRRVFFVFGVLVSMLVLGGPDPATAAPTPEAGLAHATEVAVGNTVACATARQLAYCWGDESGANGQVGDGPGQAPYGLPQLVVDRDGVGPLAQVTDVAAGDGFACAIAGASRTVYCWGRNDVGQLGNGSGSPSPIPVAVRRSTIRTLSSAIQVDAFGSTACAVVAQYISSSVGSQRRVYCWGEGSDGQLGDGTSQDRVRATTPVKLNDPGFENNPLTVIQEVTVGATHACAIQGFKTVWCWGRDGSGNDSHAYAVKVLDGGRGFCCVRSIDAGGGSTCAVTDADDRRRLYCWGGNDVGQLGVGTLDDVDEPAPVQTPGGDGDLADVTAVGVGATSACAAQGGRTFCWGLGLFGAATSILPRVVRNLTDTGDLRNVKQLAIGTTACGLLNNLQLRCWGSGQGGTLGNGSAADAPLPVVVRRLLPPPDNP